MNKNNLIKGAFSMTKFKRIQFPIHSALALVLLAASQSAFSHTRLEIPVVTEGVRVSNNVVLGHGCGDGTNVIAESVVFPDGVDSIVKVDGVQSTNVATDFISNWGNLNQKILNHSVFQFENEKNDANGNVVGFWVKGGKSPDYYTTYIPFRAGAAVIEPESCATSVKVVVAVADICRITPKSGFADGKLNLWTPAVGSDYDGPGMHGYDSPATLTYTRNLETNPLPASCNDVGVSVEVIPSAAQLNRDMPIVDKGVQVWPKP
jgi:hypothetical protein